MRIAFFSDNFYPELSGISDSIIRSAKALAERGHHIQFFAPRYSPKDYRSVGRPPEDPVFHERIGITRFASLPFGGPTGHGRIVIPTGLRYFKIRNFKPDVIHVNLPFGTGLEGLRAAKLLQVPLIGTDHTPIAEFVRYSPIRSNWIRNMLVRYNGWFYSECDFVSSPAQIILDEMRKLGFWVRGEQISNPVDLENFRPRAGRMSYKKKFGLSKFTLLYAGRLAEEKRVDLVIEAAAQLAPKIPDIGVAVVGRGPDEPRLRELARSLNIENRVKFLGFLEEQNLVEAYNAADLFVIMSAAETQSLVAMQGMAMGLPVLGANALGLAEYVNEKNGFPITPGSLDELVQKISFLYDHPEARKKLGEGGKASVRHFSPDAIARKWENIYEDVKEQYRENRSFVSQAHEAMKLSIVIPAHNEEIMIGECLSAVMREITHQPPGIEVTEVIVVNNASTDGTRRVALRYPGVHVVDEPKKGLTKARERGLNEARGDLIAYIDADTKIPAGWLLKIREAFSKRKDIVCLSGPYRYYDLSAGSKFFAELGWRLFAPLTYWIVGYMVLGGNFVARKSALRAMGGFDQNIEFYGEDTDIARRLHRVGKVVFNMNFFIWSSGRRLKHHGLLTTYIIYAINYVWQVLFHKPFTERYKDIR